MIMDKIKKCGLIPVVKLESHKSAVSLAQALLAGGVDVIEITYRTNSAAESIRQITQNVPEMLVGAGTVMTMKDLESAVDAGAKFIVSPGLDPEVVNNCKEYRIPVFPGVITPTEIQIGLKLGLSVFKFFPAESFGGVDTINALSAPFENIHFIPTGGINASNVEKYWCNDKVLAIGGSWIVPESAVNSGKYSEITKLAKDAMAIKGSTVILSC